MKELVILIYISILVCYQAFECTQDHVSFEECDCYGVTCVRGQICHYTDCLNGNICTNGEVAGIGGCNCGNEICDKDEQCDSENNSCELNVKTTILTTNPETTAPTTSPESTLPTISPESTLPTTSPESTLPTTSVESSLTIASPESTLPLTSPESIIPTTSPIVAISTTNPEPNLLTTIPQSITQITFPESTLLTTIPELTTPTTNLEPRLPITNQESTTPKTGPEPTTSTISPEPTTATTSPEPTTSTTHPKLTTPTTNPESTLPTTHPKLTTPTTSPKPTTISGTYYLLGFDNYIKSRMDNKARFNCYFNIKGILIPKIINMYLELTYKDLRHLQNEVYNKEKVKGICNFIDIDESEQIKYGCEFASNGRYLINVKVLEKYEIDGEEIYINGMSLEAESFVTNLQNADRHIFNKALFLLNDSYTNNSKYDFTITGNLNKNQKVFNYTELLLIISFLPEKETEKEIKNVNCTVFELNQSECRLKCEADESLNGEILKGFSYLPDSNLVVIFKENENKIKIEPNVNTTSNKFYTMRQKGLSAGEIVAIILYCVFVLFIVFLVILCNRFNHKNGQFEHSSNLNLKIESL